MKKFICKNCGAVSEISKEALTEALKDEEDDWLQCTLPEGFEWSLPAGKITPIVGEPIYISATGEHLSYDQFIETYNIDPEIAYNLMRGKINSTYVNRMKDILAKAKVPISPIARSKN
ncbi:MAG: hypothetical protein LUQ59_01090 [Methanothrix sp.]|nr:hypothetical protein [Methanothrix sp.]